MSLAQVSTGADWEWPDETNLSLAQVNTGAPSKSCNPGVVEGVLGKPLSHCPNGMEKQGALCYPKCKSGFYGSLTHCRMRCPSGFTDTGLHCLKPAPYGRGIGYFSFNSCASGYERWGTNCHKKCKNGYHGALAWCSPNCPSGMKDIGISCEKSKDYGRGWGEAMHCKPGQ